MSQIALELKIKAATEGLAKIQQIADALAATGTAATEASAESIVAAKKTEFAYKDLGIRSFSEIRAEIQRVREAYKQLAAAGSLSANEQIAVANATKNKLAELNNEMSGVAPASGTAGAGMAGLANQAVLLVGSLVSLNAAIALVKKASEAAMELDRMQNAMKATIGSAEGAQKEYAFVRAESDRLGLSLQNSARDYTSLTAATKGTTLAGEKTREIFTAVAEASAVLGLSTETTSGALLAIQQMVSKGTVSAEELRGQLGERLPGAFQIAARSMGVTTAELGRLLESGAVASDVFLPKFAAELKKTFSDGLPDAVKSSRAEFERLQNTIFETAAAVGQSGLNQGLAEAASILREKLADPAVQQSLKTLGKDIGDIAIASAKMVGELKVIGEVVVGGAIFSKLTGGAVATGTAALTAGQSVGLLRLGLMGLSAALPVLAGLTILYQVAQAGARAVVEYAEAHRKLSTAEKQRVTDLRAEMTQLDINIETNKKYADIQVKSAQDVLKLNPAQLAAYREQLEAKKKLELAEYGLALRKQELEKYLTQEAISTGKSKDMIALHVEAQKKAGDEATVWAGKIGATREALTVLDKGVGGVAVALKDGLTLEAGKLVAAFDLAISKSPEVSTALKQVFEGFNPNNLESVKALLDALDNIGKKGVASAQQIRTAFEKELKELDYEGLVRLQTVVDATGKKGSEAAGLIVLALGKVSAEARLAADEVGRLAKQAADLSRSQVDVAKSHLTLVRAEADVGRAKLDVMVKQNAYGREGSELARQEFTLAKNNLAIAQSKAEEARRQHAATVAANNVLITQQRQINAEKELESHLGDEVYIQKAKQAQENTANAQKEQENARTLATEQQKVTFELEEQGVKQRLVVDQARVAEEETRKIQKNMQGAADQTGKTADEMDRLARNSQNVKAPPSPAPGPRQTTGSAPTNSQGGGGSGNGGKENAPDPLQDFVKNGAKNSNFTDKDNVTWSKNSQGQMGNNATPTGSTQVSAEENRYWDFKEGKISKADAKDTEYIKGIWSAAQANLETAQQVGGEYLVSAKKSWNFARRAMESLGLSTTFGGSAGFNDGSGDTGGFGGFGSGNGGFGNFGGNQVNANSLLQQVQYQSSPLPQVNPNQAAKSSKTIQVNFTNDSGKVVPMTIDASNEQTLLDLLKRAKGVST